MGTDGGTFFGDFSGTLRTSPTSSEPGDTLTKPKHWRRHDWCGYDTSFVVCLSTPTLASPSFRYLTSLSERLSRCGPVFERDEDVSVDVLSGGHDGGRSHLGDEITGKGCSRLTFRQPRFLLSPLRHTPSVTTPGRTPDSGSHLCEGGCGRTPS